MAKIKVYILYINCLYYINDYNLFIQTKYNYAKQVAKSKITHEGNTDEDCIDLTNSSSPTSQTPSVLPSKKIVLRK